MAKDIAKENINYLEIISKLINTYIDKINQIIKLYNFKKVIYNDM